MAIAVYLGALRVAGTEAALRPVDWPGSPATLALPSAVLYLGGFARSAAWAGPRPPRQPAPGR